MYRKHVLAAASALAMVATGTLAVSARAETPPTARVALPSPNYGPLNGSPAAADPTRSMPLRVYLAGSDPSGWTQTALAASDPTGPAYARYLTPAQFEQRFGPTSAQISAVTAWLESEGMTVTATNENYLTVSADIGQIDAAFDTEIGIYTTTVPIAQGGYSYTTYGASNGFSAPASVGADIATVTGMPDYPGESDQSPASPASTGPSASPTPTLTSSGFQCSQYWGQHTERIPAAYGHTTAPTQLCGYTVKQLRSAYGVSTALHRQGRHHRGSPRQLSADDAY